MVDMDGIHVKISLRPFGVLFFCLFQSAHREGPLHFELFLWKIVNQVFNSSTGLSRDIPIIKLLHLAKMYAQIPSQ